jgi:predicted DNA-binding transcriptional regulator AlpA
MNIIDPQLKDKEAAAIFGFSVPTFWRRVADGTIKPPVKIGGTSRWPQSEILATIEHAKAARGLSLTYVDGIPSKGKLSKTERHEYTDYN